MKTKTLILSGVVALLLTACIPSVYPFYTAKDVAFNPRLVGEWTTKDSSDEPQHWQFEPEPDDTYALTVTDDEGKQGRFKATLFKLKDDQFLDLIPTQCDYATNQAELVSLSMFPGHLLVHVAQIDPELKLAFCDFDWLEKYLKAHPKALAHHRDTEVLLTASTRDLQRFVLEHVADEELFSEYGELTRNTNSPATNPKAATH